MPDNGVAVHWLAEKAAKMVENHPKDTALGRFNSTPGISDIACIACTQTRAHAMDNGQTLPRYNLQRTTKNRATVDFQVWETNPRFFWRCNRS